MYTILLFIFTVARALMRKKNGLGFGILQVKVTDEHALTIITKKCNAYTCINNIYLLLFKNPAIIKIIVIY